MMQFKSGDVYDGQWVRGNIEGYGLYMYAKTDDADEEGTTCIG